MPFTLSHVMAVLPGVRWHERLRLDPTCLVIGSMAPDFEYFVRGEQVSRISHTLLGIVVWNLPATLLLGALWHVLVKRPALAVLPAGLGARATTVFGGPWRERWDLWAVLGLVLSAVLGAFTHLAWDAVSHENEIIARWVPAITNVYNVPLLGPTAVHRIFHNVSSVIGLVVVTFYVARALRRARPAPRNELPTTQLRLVFAACLAIGVALMAVRLHRMHLHDPGSVISGMISGLLAGTLVASALTWRPAHAPTS